MTYQDVLRNPDQMDRPMLLGLDRDRDIVLTLIRIRSKAWKPEAMSNDAPWFINDAGPSFD